MRSAQDILTDNLNRIMVKNGWDIADFARAIGVPYTNLHKIIKGSRGSWLLNLDPIAQGLHIHVSDLLKEQGVVIPPPPSVREPSPMEALEIVRKALSKAGQ